MKALIFTIISALLLASCQPADDEIYQVNPKGGKYEKQTYCDTLISQPCQHM